MTTSSVAPAARPILAYDRRTGAPVAMVPSCSKPGAYHLVTASTCDCKGFTYRGRCRHIAPGAPAAEAEPLPCTGCHNYHRTDAERLRAHPDARPLADGGRAHLAVLRASGAWLS